MGREGGRMLLKTMVDLFTHVIHLALHGIGNQLLATEMALRDFFMNTVLADLIRLLPLHVQLMQLCGERLL